MVDFAEIGTPTFTAVCREFKEANLRFKEATEQLENGEIRPKAFWSAMQRYYDARAALAWAIDREYP